MKRLPKVPPKESDWREHTYPKNKKSGCNIVPCPVCGRLGCIGYIQDEDIDGNKLISISHAHFINQYKYTNARNWHHETKSVKCKPGDLKISKRLTKQGLKYP